MSLLLAEGIGLVERALSRLFFALSCLVPIFCRFIGLDGQRMIGREMVQIYWKARRRTGFGGEFRFRRIFRKNFVDKSIGVWAEPSISICQEA